MRPIDNGGAEAPAHLSSYRRWFYAATVYNTAWAIIVITLPVQTARLIGIDPSSFIPFVQVIGMMVGVFAIGYYFLARDPRRYCGFIWIAIAGKTLGPLGFVYYAAQGALPWSFGWTCVLNDLIWWPAFWSFALRYARAPLASLPDQSYQNTVESDR